MPILEEDRRKRNVSERLVSRTAFFAEEDSVWLGSRVDDPVEKRAEEEGGENSGGKDFLDPS